jgi:hypothetical protein
MFARRRSRGDRGRARPIQRHFPGQGRCPSGHARPAARRSAAVGTSPEWRRERAVRSWFALRSAARPTGCGRSWGRRRRCGRGQRSRCRPVCARFSHRGGQRTAARIRRWDLHYAAKHAADEAVRTSGLRWTVIRPGALSDEAPTGYVSTMSHASALTAAFGRHQVPRPTGHPPYVPRLSAPGMRLRSCPKSRANYWGRHPGPSTKGPGSRRQ